MYEKYRTSKKKFKSSNTTRVKEHDDVTGHPFTYEIVKYAPKLSSLLWKAVGYKNKNETS
jgi:hypothetical protein